MGKDWHWSRGRTGSDKTEKRRHHYPLGCMSSFFQLFHLQRVLFSASPTSSSEKVEVLKGIEAPRNSMELDLSATTTASSVSAFDHDYEVPFGIIQVVVPKRNSLVEQELRSSGNVVAKLMGLESLPESCLTPRSDSNGSACEKQKRRMKQKAMELASRRACRTPPPRHPLQPRNGNFIAVDDFDVRRGTRSLPETPRVSIARRSWDSDPRLSVTSRLQNRTRPDPLPLDKSVTFSLNRNKENIETNVSNTKSMTELKWVSEDKSRKSPSPPTQKVKKKERRTPLRPLENDKNTPSSSPNPSQYAKEIVKQVKDSVNRRRNKAMETSPPNKPQQISTTLSTSSPRQVKNTDSVSKHVVSLKPTTKPTNPCNKWSCDRYTEKLKKSPSQPTTTTTKKGYPLITPSPAKKTSVVKENYHVSAPTLPDQHAKEFCTLIKSHNVTRTTLGEFNYVQRVLEKAKVRSHLGRSSTVRRDSRSQPLDPIIFHQLELTSTFPHAPTHHRCNRLLLFDLVDEILSDPHLNAGDNTLETVWSRIKTFPAANCQVMDDIDNLVSSDLPVANFRRLLWHPAAAEEAQIVAGDVSQWVLDALLDDTASTLLQP